jgi:hypothetical protein
VKAIDFILVFEISIYYRKLGRSPTFTLAVKCSSFFNTFPLNIMANLHNIP